MESNRIHIGAKAPDFTANSTFGPLKMSDYKGKWVILFSHPGDFTPVCTTEFVAFAKANDKFVDKDTQIIGLSIDSNPSHLAWVHSIKNITGVTIPFPVIADRMGEVAMLYGMIAPDVSNHETVRTVFFIDPQQVIRAILIYPMTNGRNIQEIYRLLVALQTSDARKVVTPADWIPGEPVMVPPPQTYNQMLDRMQNPQDSGLECRDWFWCYSMIMPLAKNSSAQESAKIPENIKIPEGSPVAGGGEVLRPQTAPPDVKYKLDGLITDVEVLINRINFTRPSGTRQEQHKQFLMLKNELEQSGSKVNLLKSRVKADYVEQKIISEEYNNTERILNALDDRLNRAESVLERILGPDR